MCFEPASVKQALRSSSNGTWQPGAIEKPSSSSEGGIVFNALWNYVFNFLLMKLMGIVSSNILKGINNSVVFILVSIMASKL